jgi:hypothetical protein
MPQPPKAENPELQPYQRDILAKAGKRLVIVTPRRDATERLYRFMAAVLRRPDPE